ncbi:hypothetical protein V1477_017902 [Vespula maculifrons]|uniref:Uncharacterized protein n=1 Tax=Vespula maculifrons TaxID=7453 RepID=A0ABD2AZR0_VESMC
MLLMMATSRRTKFVSFTVIRISWGDRTWSTKKLRLERFEQMRVNARKESRVTRAAFKMVPTTFYVLKTFFLATVDRRTTYRRVSLAVQPRLLREHYSASHDVFRTDRVYHDYRESGSGGGGSGGGGGGGRSGGGGGGGGGGGNGDGGRTTVHG